VAEGDETGTAGVVVGVDGSPGSREALVWALAEAARRGWRLQAVSAFPVEVYWSDPQLLDERRIEAVRADTEARVQALVDEVVGGLGGGGSGGGVAVEVLALPGPAALRLLAAAGTGDLLVVGSRGRGPVRSTVLGSVALHAVTHSRCPVVVVHARKGVATGTSRVVVGLDGSEGSRRALAHAVDEAALLGAEVAAVAAYSLVSYWSGAYEVVVPAVERVAEDARRRAEEMVSEVASHRPAVAIRTMAVEGGAGSALVHAAEGAELLVVGGRGRGAITGILLGSVALHCVIHAPCPVMVVPTGRDGAAVG
jgi:nucleotide-binding universal stress UspA family protein